MILESVNNSYWNDVYLKSDLAAMIHSGLLWISPYITSVAATFLLLGLLYKLWDVYVTRNAGLRLKLPPGSSGWPLFGETIPFVVDGRKYFRSRIKTHGQVFRSYLITSPTVVVCGAQNVRKILNGEGDIVTINSPPTCDALFGASSILGSTGAVHHARHLSVRRAFNHENLTLITPRIAEIVHMSIQSWCRNGSVFAVNECKKMVFEIGAEAILGIKFGCKDSSLLMKEFEEFSDNFFSMPFDFPGSGFRRAKQARRRFLDILLTHINIDTDCLLKVLRQELHDNKENKEHANGMVLEILFAMTCTTASAMSAFIKTLASHADIINSVRHEVKGLVQDLKLDSYKDFTYQQMCSDMPYVNAVLKEVLRLNPPVAGGFRKALKTFEIDGYHVPAGWGVLYCITDTHEQAPDFTSNFNPDQWLKTDHQKDGSVPSSDSESQNEDSTFDSKSVSSDSQTTFSDLKSDIRHRFKTHHAAESKPKKESQTRKETASRYDFIPFSAGPRVCPGKEFAKHFLRIFIIQLCMTSKWSLDNPGAPVKTAPIPFPADGLPIHIEHGIAKN